MYNSFISSEAPFKFPPGLKKHQVYKAEDNKSKDRIIYLYEESYGVSKAAIKDKSDPVNLHNLVTNAYIPYLERCCDAFGKKAPLVRKLPSTIRIAHGCIQHDKTDVNTILNYQYCRFISTLHKEPYSHEELKEAGLLGPSFYAADEQKTSSDEQKQAESIRTYANLADKSAPDAVSTILKAVDKSALITSNYNGPIWTRFWQLEDTNTDKHKLIGICGHTPLGKLPMIYAKNMCCDTTYADDGFNPEKRPAMGIKARLISQEQWRFDIVLESPVEAFYDGVSKQIKEYYIHNNAMEDNPDITVVQNKNLYKHYVGRTTIDGDIYSIWRTVLVGTNLKPNEEDFWREKAVYTLTRAEHVTIADNELGGDTYNIITDIEGNLSFFEKSLELGQPDTKLILLGDTWDRGNEEEELKIWELIQKKYGGQDAICIVGNRDANKVRWICELYNDFKWNI